MNNKTPQWGEKFNAIFGGDSDWGMADKETEREIKAFIKSTLEELINDIPEVSPQEQEEGLTVDFRILKQQLKDKWL